MVARLALATVSALAVLAAPASASCLPGSEAQRLARAQAVFTGRVLSVSPNGASARFRVLSVRKGPVRRGSVVRVVAGAYPSSVTMRWSPRKGERWRIGAQRRNGRWITNDCLGTTPL